jgi:hypothetical protein
MRRALCVMSLLAVAGGVRAQQSLPPRSVVHVWTRTHMMMLTGFVEKTRGDTVIVQLLRDTYGWHPMYLTDTLPFANIDSLDIDADATWQRLYPSNDSAHSTYTMYTTVASPRLHERGAVVRLWSTLHGFADQRATVSQLSWPGDTLRVKMGKDRRAIALADIDTLRLRMAHGGGRIRGALKGLAFGELYASFGDLAANSLCNLNCHFSRKSVNRYFGTFGVVGLVLGAHNGRERETWIDVRPRSP